MIGLSDLVQRIRSDIFEPHYVKRAELFLEKFETLTLVEHLLLQKMVNLMQVKATLMQYASLIKSDMDNKETHLIALAKYIRLMCLHIIKKHELDQIAVVVDAIPDYFPFLCENETNAKWLPQFLADTQMAETIYQLLVHTSYKIKIGERIAQDELSQSPPDPNATTNYLRKMAEHRLYATHRNNAINVLNQATATAGYLLGKVPLFSYMLENVQEIASNYGYEERTTTARTKRILGYIEPMRLLYSKNISEPYGTETLEKIVRKVELLTMVYLEGSSNLRQEMITQLNEVIMKNKNNEPLLGAILKIIAPEPLGEMAYGMQQNPCNILGALSIESNQLLINACTQFFTGNDLKAFKTTISKLKSPIASINLLNFDKQMCDYTRWLAYLLCMGNVVEVKTITIHYMDLAHADHLLLSYLMGSSKLVVLCSCPIHTMILSPMPLQCMFKITHETMRYAMMADMASMALKRGTPELRLGLTASDDYIRELLNDISYFESTAARARLMVEIVTEPTSSSSDNTEPLTIDFTLTKEGVQPGLTSLKNEKNKRELIRLMLLAFSHNNKKRFEAPITRPIALPESVVMEKSLLDQLKTIEGKHWVLVYTENGSSSTPGKKFLCDITLSREPESNIARIEAGFFSRLMDHSSHLSRLLPDVIANTSSSAHPLLLSSYEPAHVVESGKDRNNIFVREYT